MGATHPTFEKLPGLLVKGSKNTPNQQPQLYLKHCKDFHHLLPSITDFSIIDEDPSQITREAKEAHSYKKAGP